MIQIIYFHTPLHTPSFSIVKIEHGQPDDESYHQCHGNWFLLQHYTNIILPPIPLRSPIWLFIVGQNGTLRVGERVILWVFNEWVMNLMISSNFKQFVSQLKWWNFFTSNGLNFLSVQDQNYIDRLLKT